MYVDHPVDDPDHARRCDRADAAGRVDDSVRSGRAARYGVARGIVRGDHN